MCASRVSSSSGQDYPGLKLGQYQQPDDGLHPSAQFQTLPIVTAPNRSTLIHIPQQTFFPTIFNNEPALAFTGVVQPGLPEPGVYQLSPSFPAASPATQAPAVAIDDQAAQAGEESLSQTTISSETSSASEPNEEGSAQEFKPRHVSPGEVDKLIRRKTLARVEWESFERYSNQDVFKPYLWRKDDALVWMLGHPGRVERLDLRKDFDAAALDAVEVCLLTRVIQAGGLRELSFYLDAARDLDDPLMHALFEAIKAGKLERVTLDLLAFDSKVVSLLPRLAGTVTELTLIPGMRPPQESALQSFMQQARTCNASIKLRLRSHDAGDEDKLVALLASDLQVTGLELKATMTRAIADAIKASHSLVELHLPSDVGEAGTALLLEVLRANTQLRNVDVFGIPHARAAELLDVVKGNSALQSLKVFFRDEMPSLDEPMDLTQPLAELLGANHTLQALSLRALKFNPDDAVSKANLLQSFAANTSLRKLALELRGEDKGMLGELLRVNGVLEEARCIGHGDVEAIGNALQTNSSLKSLTVYTHWKNQKEMTAFSLALEKNSSLTDLNLGNDQAGTAVLVPLLKALASNTTLVRLNGLGPEIRRLVERRANRKLAVASAPVANAAPASTAASSANLPFTS